MSKHDKANTSIVEEMKDYYADNTNKRGKSLKPLGSNAQNRSSSRANDSDSNEVYDNSNAYQDGNFQAYNDQHVKLNFNMMDGTLMQ